MSDAQIDEAIARVLKASVENEDAAQRFRNMVHHRMSMYLVGSQQHQDLIVLLEKFEQARTEYPDSEKQAGPSPGSPYQEVPVGVAATIGRQFGKSQVVIIAIDDAHQMIHFTGWGDTMEDKRQAAAMTHSIHQLISAGQPKTVYSEVPK